MPLSCPQLLPPPLGLCLISLWFYLSLYSVKSLDLSLGWTQPSSIVRGPPVLNLNRASKLQCLCTPYCVIRSSAFCSTCATNGSNKWHMSSAESPAISNSVKFQSYISVHWKTFLDMYMQSYVLTHTQKWIHIKSVNLLAHSMAYNSKYGLV